jgi:hypothetical protein
MLQIIGVGELYELITRIIKNTFLTSDPDAPEGILAY